MFDDFTLRVSCEEYYDEEMWELVNSYYEDELESTEQQIYICRGHPRTR